MCSIWLASYKLSAALQLYSHVMKKFYKCMFLVFAMLACCATFAQDLSSYLAASQTLQSKIDAAEQKKSMPRLTDPDVAPLITLLSDSQTFLDSNNFTVNETGRLMEVCSAANKIVVSYMLFGLKNQANKPTSNSDAITRTRSVMRKNASTYHPEFTLLQPFTIKCLAKVVPLLSGFVKSLKKEEITEIRLSGLRLAKTGMTGMFTGVLELASDPDLNPALKMVLVKTLTENADKFRSLLSIQVRQQIAGYISALLPTTETKYAEYFQKIQAEMSNTTCEDLCLIN